MKKTYFRKKINFSFQITTKIMLMFQNKFSQEFVLYDNEKISPFDVSINFWLIDFSTKRKLANQHLLFLILLIYKRQWTFFLSSFQIWILLFRKCKVFRFYPSAKISNFYFHTKYFRDALIVFVMPTKTLGNKFRFKFGSFLQLFF